LGGALHRGSGGLLVRSEASRHALNLRNGSKADVRVECRQWVESGHWSALCESVT
jgi:hypothetical protein